MWDESKSVNVSFCFVFSQTQILKRHFWRGPGKLSSRSMEEEGNKWQLQQKLGILGLKYRYGWATTSFIKAMKNLLAQPSKLCFCSAFFSIQYAPTFLIHFLCSAEHILGSFLTITWYSVPLNADGAVRKPYGLWAPNCSLKDAYLCASSDGRERLRDFSKWEVNLM